MVKRVFQIGHGYIGGSLLVELLKDEQYELTVLVRSDDKAARLKALGVKSIKGGFDDQEIIANAVSRADIVIHVAFADDVPSVEAVLKGLRQRPASSDSAIYIHTSGTGQLSDEAAGRYGPRVAYSDDEPEGLDALPPTAQHRNVDLIILKAIREEKINARIAIMYPPCIYGLGSGPFNKQSIQIPALIRGSIKLRAGLTVNASLHAWSSIHVHDLVRGYITLLDAIQSHKIDLTNPYFFCENNQPFLWRAISYAVAQALVDQGLMQHVTLKHVPDELAAELMGSKELTYDTFAHNSISRAERLRGMGWKPHEVDVFRTIDEEVATTLKAEHQLQ
ncbi:uncharacterized protein L969DRAFT_95770 [Mixia osmundae IAM 14324]|uniref:NAD(P)-binding domain-containing protein n=1 Tax=Mixia osmundae (strain CBS 9802 / IAM 14324 / JCM 22182 / KY 12970) TaxID=764103 RepID=G7DSM4_MIXOS|nr:uncharacterized protein L969DRAFT_95770 [Mixia osmundae IAM 14324]KEI37920.1 hypothetical protein L969DRAFT_95770 [Mixia osmundae IAM 14324]GAA93584.1 hypothetical protein E5Q_00228 [Mixia osmundae IAM 14324]